MKITLVPKEHVKEIWPVVEPMLEGATEYFQHRYDTIDIYIEIEKGDQTLWVAFDEENQIKGCFTVRIVDYPNARCCSVDFVGGENLDEWLGDTVEVVTSYAKEFGCTRLEGTGRLGWIKKMKKFGFNNTAIRFDLPIGEDNG